MKLGDTLYAQDRASWRRWLERHHASAKEIWLVYPKKHTGKPRLAYNDAVEEALCFGWIDSTQKTVDADHTAQRFSPRRKGSAVSPMNRERIERLMQQGLMTKAGLDAIGKLQPAKLEIAPDLLRALKKDPVAWKNFRAFPPSYQRIRVGWIEGARSRPQEFEKRLRYFLKMTALNKQYGMVR